MRGRFALVAVLALTGLEACCLADAVDREWVFVTPGNYLSWTMNKYIDKGVADGSLYGTTTATDSSIVSPDLGAGIAATPSHYIQIRMRMRLATGLTDRYGASDASIYFKTVADPTYTGKLTTLKTYGNGAWKTYNVRMGHLATWTGNIKQIKPYLTGKTGAQTEVAWIRVMRDTTPPSFEAENMWTYDDGQSTNDSTPTISLRNCHDLVSGIDRAEFYHRPGSSTSGNDWVLGGIDFSGSDGYQYTYGALPDGVYDLGVKVYDKSGNIASWLDDDDNWIDDLAIDSALQTTISVDAATAGDIVPEGVLGHNLAWFHWSSKYNPATKQLYGGVEPLVAAMGISVLRYPGGCFSDTFYWKQSIGPVASRPVQYSNDCNRTLKSQGKAKFGIDEFVQWCQARGIEPLLTCRFRWPGAPPAQAVVNGQTVTLDGPDPYAEALADAIDLVEYCNSPNDGSNPNGGTDWAAVRAANGRAGPYNVRYFEVGNEPWGPDPWGSPGNTGLDGPSEYSVAFLSYLEGMKAVDPSIQVSLTTQTRSQVEFDPANPDWAISAYEQGGSYVDFAQIHPYMPYSCWQADPIKLYDETMATPKALDDQIAVQRSLIRITTPEKAGAMKLWLTEWNINYGWYNDPASGRINMYHTKTLKAAIAATDALRVFIENRDLVHVGNWWHLWSSTICTLIEGMTDTPTPAYHAYRIFGKHFGPRLVASKVVGSPTFDYVKSGGVLTSQFDLPYLTAIASRSDDGRSLYVVVTNKDRVNPRSANINLSSFLLPPFEKVIAGVWELNGPSVDDYVNWNLVRITESSAEFVPSFNYSFPAHSVTSFKFTAKPVDVTRAKSAADGARVELTGKTVSAVFAGDVFYTQDADRAGGIKVLAAGVSPVEGSTVSVAGTIRTGQDGERYIEADSVTTP